MNSPQGESKPRADGRLRRGHLKLAGIASAIALLLFVFTQWPQRTSDAARVTVAELSAYHELMRQSVLLISELERKLAELADAARNSTGHLPSVDQLHQVISNVRLAYQIYNETK